MEVNLDAYFDRIGYQGPRTPTAATLAELHQAHLRRSHLRTWMCCSAGRSGLTWNRCKTSW